MKKTKFLTLSLIMLACTAGVFAQTEPGSASATATATAVILTPLSITTQTNMDFGDIVAGAGGDVVLNPQTVARSTTGPAVFGTFSLATFNVTGNNDGVLTISLPADHTITRATGTETMDIDAFSSFPSGTITLSAAGAGTLTVGATLNVGASQVPGTYENAAGFTVTVNYQ